MNPFIKRMLELGAELEKCDNSTIKISMILNDAEIAQTELLIDFSKWKEEKGYNPIYDHKGLVNEYLNSLLNN